jgi:ABC-2 type transport system ATP-binding protein
MSRVSFENVTKQLGGTVAVDEVSFTVETGEVFGLVGPNGAGKSTLFDMLMDYIRPTAGAVRVFGTRLDQQGSDVRSRIGAVPDDCGLVERLTGRDHVELERRARQIDTASKRIVEQFDMDDSLDTPVGEYSRGMKQRLLLSMAFAGSPDLLVLDEPATGLDPDGVEQLRDRIAEAADNDTTVLVSSHRLERVVTVADRIGVLVDGSLSALDTVDTIRERAGATTELSIMYDGGPDELSDIVTTLDGVEAANDDGETLQVVFQPSARSSILETLRRHDVRILDFDETEPDLSEVFRRFTDG